jgi:4-alpha-glucanotransferase
MTRESGILLHPTSLPGRSGIGDLGPAAYRFVDFLAESGQTIWQILPLGPPGYGNSPYQALSSFAGNPMLVSLEALVEEGWLVRADLESDPGFPAERVDFGAVIPYKERLLGKAARAFRERAGAVERAALDEFGAAARAWLDSYAAFAALKAANGGCAWTEWTARDAPATADVDAERFTQFAFRRQWGALKRYANAAGVEIVGDLPIFVAHDSADVWAHPDLFDLDPNGRARTIAGVPPDYFSATGQCWGNPLYRWDRMAETGYAWWIDRVRATLELVDRVRLDHFRGFEMYWEIPGGATTAVVGRWVDGPGARLFEALERALGRLHFIAEDLGYITPEVHALRERFGFPGMRVLQFGFDGSPAENPFLPHNYVRNCVVYTGTHDNDTTVGWFRNANPGASTTPPEEARRERARALRYFGSDGSEIHWDFVRAVLGSVAETAVIPLQDVLGLGSEARMNLPATAENNWVWRFREQDLTSAHAARLRELTEIYGRLAPAG